MSTYYLDTNIFLRVAAKEDEKIYKECFLLLKNVQKGEIKAITSKIVIAEIVWTLSSFYKFKKNRVVGILNSILALSGLSIVDDGSILTASKLYEEHNVKFADCVIASMKGIQNREIVVISYDTDFDKLDVLRKTPGEIVED